jgi:hypothetical protein
LSLAQTTEHIVKVYRVVEVKLHSFLTSALDGGEWSASYPSHFNPGERIPLDTNLVGHTVILDMVTKRKILYTSWESNPSCVAYSQSLYSVYHFGSLMQEVS